MTVHDGVQLVCTIGTVGLIGIAHDRLRMKEPRVRMALGAIGILLAAFLLFGVNLLPHPWERGFSPFVDATAFAGSVIFAGLFLLSLLEIGGGARQAIKRWRYYRRSVG